MTAHSAHSEIVVASPMAGWIWPLSETPDAVFAGGVMGPGVAIDPVVGEVRAPLSGEIVTLNASKHAVVLRHASGLEILVHVGIDTVGMGGRGFQALVAEGQAVREGDLLIRFELDEVAGGAKSLVSPVVVVNSDAFEVSSAAVDTEIAVGAPLMRVLRRKAVGSAGPAPASAQARREVTIALEHGVHARPAAAISKLVRDHGVAGSLSTAEGRKADLRSVAAMMALGLKKGDPVAIHVEGSGADEAAVALAELLQGGFREEPVQAAPAAALRPQESARDGVIRGVSGAPGLAVGRAFHVRVAEIDVVETGRGADAEAEALTAALAQAAAEILSHRASGQLSQVLEAHLALIEDSELRRLAFAQIAEGRSAGFAWKLAIASFVALFEGAGDPRLSERVADLRDVELRILKKLLGDAAARPVQPPAGSILLAEDLFPSQLAEFQAALLVGICLARGGPTSHVAIIAASLGLPMLTAAGEAALSPADGQMLILDADVGELHLRPEPEALARASREIEARSARAELERQAAQAPALTRDQLRIEVLANLGAAAEAAPSVEQGAEGCGLLRTEFLFMERATPPSEEEQRSEYQKVLDGLEGRPLTIRTLDAGGDKPIAYLPEWREANPALGMRGIRTSLAVPDLLRTQLRAILQVRPLSAISIMAPMVTGIGELREVRSCLTALQQELGLDIPVELGLMIETPSSVMIAEQLAREADFFSIGTNDLSQYVLAMDRTNDQLAAAADALHPAVLRAVALTVAGARRYGRKVSVCGGLASDLTAVPLLIGLGVTRLSCTPSLVPRIKGLVRTLDAAAWAQVAKSALELDDAIAVRNLVRRMLPTSEA